MQNLLSDFMISIDTGYLSCVLWLIFVHGLLHVLSLALSHFDCCFISAEIFFQLAGLTSNVCFAEPRERLLGPLPETSSLAML